MKGRSIKFLTRHDDRNFQETLQQRLNGLKFKQDKYQTIVDVPFLDAYESTKLDLGIVVLLLVNKHNKTIDRVALSDTEPAKGAVSISTISFEEIKIPLGDEENAIAKAIDSQTHQIVSDWKYLFTPVMDEISARHNQSGAGIGCSLVYPLLAADKSFGAMIFSFFQPPENLRKRHFKFAERYAALVSETLSPKS